MRYTYRFYLASFMELGTCCFVSYNGNNGSNAAYI